MEVMLTLASGNKLAATIDRHEGQPFPSIVIWNDQGTYRRFRQVREGQYQEDMPAREDFEYVTSLIVGR